MNSEHPLAVAGMLYNGLFPPVTLNPNMGDFNPAIKLVIVPRL